MATIRNGHGNEYTSDSITHTDDITSGIKQVLGIAENMVPVVNGVENYSGSLLSTDTVDFRTVANKKG